MVKHNVITIIDSFLTALLDRLFLNSFHPFHHQKGGIHSRQVLQTAAKRAVQPGRRHHEHEEQHEVNGTG